MTVNPQVNLLDSSALVVVFVLKLIVKSQTVSDLKDGKLRPEIVESLFKDFGVSAMFSLLNGEPDVSDKVSQELLLKCIPSSMVDADIIPNLLALADDNGDLLFTDFKALMDYGRALSDDSALVNASDVPIDTFKWWDPVSLNELDVVLTLSDTVTLQMIVDWLAYGSSSSGVARAKSPTNAPYKTKPLLNFTYAEATTDSVLLGKLEQIIASSDMTCAKLSPIFAYQSLLVANVDVANIKSTYSVLMSSLVSFFKDASGTSSLDVNSKFSKVIPTSQVPAGSSTKYVALKIAMLLVFPSSDVLGNSDFKSAIYSSNDVAKDFNVIFSSAFTNISLTDRLVGASNDKSLVLSDMMSHTLAGDSLASIMAAIKDLLDNEYSIEGYSPLVQRTVEFVLNRHPDSEYTEDGLLSEAELESLSVLYSLSKIGEIIVFNNDTKTFKLDDLIESAETVSAGVTVTQLLAKEVIFYRDPVDLTPKITNKLEIWEEIRATLSSDSLRAILSAVDGVTFDDLFVLLLSTINNTTNETATAAVTGQLTQKQIFKLEAKGFSNNQLPFSLYLSDCFSSTSKMSLKLPSLLSAIKIGFGNGENGLTATEVRASIKSAVAGVGEKTGPDAINVSSTVTDIDSESANFGAYKEQTLAGALMTYLLANRVSADIVLETFGENTTVADKPQMAETMIKTLNSINVERVVIRSFFPVLKSIGAEALHKEWPLGESRDGRMADVWPFTFFDKFYEYCELVVAIGGLGFDGNIKLLMSYIRLTSRVNVDTGIITTGVSKVAISSGWFIHPHDQIVPDGFVVPEQVIEISQLNYNEMQDDVFTSPTTTLKA